MPGSFATQTILDSALRRANGRRIIGIHVLIGELSDHTEDSVRSNWDTLTKGTPAEEAKLYFRHVKAELQCMACFGKYHPESGKISCPTCGSVGAKVLAGEEFSLESIDVR